MGRGHCGSRKIQSPVTPIALKANGLGITKRKAKMVSKNPTRMMKSRRQFIQNLGAGASAALLMPSLTCPSAEANSYPAPVLLCYKMAYRSGDNP